MEKASETIQILIGIIISPITLYFHWKVKRKERVLREQMKRKNRYLSWLEVETKLKNREGTIIVECGYSNVRFWWTPDCILGKTHLILESDKQKLPYPQKTPFSDWCHSRYLDTSFGSAFLFECFSNSAFDSFEFLSNGVSVIKVPFIPIK